MADRAFKLEVVTPDRVVFADRVTSVVMPGAEGSFGILANHAPLVSQLALGELDFRKPDGRWDAIALSGGFAEVLDNSVTVLAETAELRQEIDIDRAERAKTRAQERIASHMPDVDSARAEVALKRALNRLAVARGRDGA